MGNVGQVFFENPALVVQSLCLPIAPAQNRDPDPPPAVPAGDPLDHRRLAGSAQREIADRNDRHVRAVDRGPSTVKSGVANGDGGAIRGSSQPQAGACKLRPEPASLAANQTEIRSPVESAQAPASIARLIALAISSVPTAVGSSRLGFMS